MSFRIFVTGSGLAPAAETLLHDEGCVSETGDPRDTPADLVAKLTAFNPDGLIVRQGQITAEVLAAAQNLKVICKHGVGLDNIDVEAAKRRGIPVHITGGANTEAAAEHTLALILALLRDVPYEDRRIRGGLFDKRSYAGQELAGKTVGLIGFGRIGRRVAELLPPFHAKAVAYHPSGIATLKDVLSQADIVSLHCPLTPETRGMICAETMLQMKRGVYLINTARGGLVNESDLIRALHDRHIAGAALDVFEAEPLAVDNLLLQLENVILTPHVAGSSDQSLANMGLESVRTVLGVLRSKTSAAG